MKIQSPMNGRSLAILGAVLVSAALLLPACDSDASRRADHSEADGFSEGYGETTLTFGELPVPLPDGVVALCRVEPLEGHETRGYVLFLREGRGIRVRAEIDGLEPGAHGFHVHGTGDCSAPDGTSAGGHFDPDGSPHGAPDAPASARHVGDLGNLVATDLGRGTYDRLDTLITVTGDHSILGRAVIVHAGEDDLTSQPSGDAGARVACGIVVRPG